MAMMAKGITTLAKELQNRDRKVVICETFFYLLIISVAIIGNSCVLLAVYRNSRLRTIPNYYIVSLAISDILLPLLCAPNSIVVAIVGYWPFNDNVCQTQGFFVIILACASLLTLTLTAINRFYRLVLTKRYRRIFTKRRTLIMIAFGVGLACLEPLPYLISGRRYVFHPGKLFCFQTAEISFPNFIVYFYVGVPTFTLSICYALVFRQIRIHRRTVQNLRSCSTAVDNITHADVRVTKILFITVMGLLACWMPIAVIDFIDTFRGEVSFPRQVYVFYLFLGNFSGAINPFLYGFLNRNLRREYRKIFSLRKRNSRLQHLQIDLTSFSTRNPCSTELTAN
ncbi:melatonin receptor type 1B-B-like [Stylophora pistillata]|uniref:melatonin receptor type 1B-B-like n=1 Tax=Stylophora pistillata TaxID=50429 RepID=UPI000C03C4FB|nr:melatonin receptor type 1B-B-like [Stylophora pistillata]